jgi:hypothetical protein
MSAFDRNLILKFKRENKVILNVGQLKIFFQEYFFTYKINSFFLNRIFVFIKNRVKNNKKNLFIKLD